MSNIVRKDNTPIFSNNNFFSNYVSNLFGTVARQAVSPLGSSMDFIPQGANGEVIQLRGDISAAWLGLQNPLMQKFAYEYCYPVSSVIDRIAEMDVAGEIEINRQSGKGKEEPATSPYAVAMNKLFKHPNPMQSWSMFRAQQTSYKKIFGYCPVFVVIPAGFENQPWMATAMFNLPPWLFNAIPNPKWNMYDPNGVETGATSPISHYTLSYLGKFFTIQPQWVFILEDGVMPDNNKYFLLPESKLVGLDMPVSNICAALEADNVLLKKKGPLGFIGHDPGAKDHIAGYLPMTKRDKTQLQKDLMQYGLSLDKFQYVISRTAARWNPMSYNVTELGTKETIIGGSKAVCHRFGFPYVLYEASETTYANQNQAARDVYQNVIIPASDKDMEKYEQFFLADKNNCDIDLCYDHLQVMQENKLEKAQSDHWLSKGLEVDFRNGIISKNQWRTAKGYELVAGDDTAYVDPTTIASTPTA